MAYKIADEMNDMLCRFSCSCSNGVRAVPASGVHIDAGEQALNLLLDQWTALLSHGLLQLVGCDGPTVVGIHSL